MAIATNYKEEIIDLSKKLSNDKLKELIDFAWFLKVREKGFSYTEIKDSAEYVKNIRMKEEETFKSPEKFIEELIQWQKSNS